MKPFKGILLSSLFLILVTANSATRAETVDVEATATEEKLEQTGSDNIEVRIADPYIEIHTGPGAAYPIFYVIDRGDVVTILRRKTDWFKIESKDGRTGWASRAQMQQTLLPDGEQFVIPELTEEDFAQRQWVLGVTGGEFESAPVFTVFTAYSFTENVAGEVHLGQSVGSVSSSLFWKTNLVMQPLPDLKYSPYLTLGLGTIKVSPSATLIISGNETSTFAQFGFGVQRYVSRSFLLRFEANEYVIFSNDAVRNNNEEVNEWKFGFAVFF